MAAIVSSTDFVKLAAEGITDFSILTFHVKYKLSTMDIANPGYNFSPSMDFVEQFSRNESVASKEIRIDPGEITQV